METPLYLSIVIAVYQRQDELRALLDSLCLQTNAQFEVVVVDDGSPEPLEGVVDLFKDKLTLNYYYKSNSGPGSSRNFGMQKAKGNFFVFLDSDTLAPKDYIENVYLALHETQVDFFGGVDMAAKDFSALQKAISFAMTSFLTTGGVRGGKKKVGKFQPRSFNMGISKACYEATGGFGNLRIGEDPDLTLTLWEKGFVSQGFDEVKVYHKRRTSLAKFLKQVHQFGIARPILNHRHPAYTQLTFWFPSLFLLGSVFALLLAILGVCIYPLVLLVVYLFLVCIMASMQEKSLLVGILSVVATIFQFYGYGWGFLKSWVALNVLGLKPEKAFPQHFSSHN